MPEILSGLPGFIYIFGFTETNYNHTAHYCHPADRVSADGLYRKQWNSGPRRRVSGYRTPRGLLYWLPFPDADRLCSLSYQQTTEEKAGPE